MQQNSVCRISKTRVKRPACAHYKSKENILTITLKIAKQVMEKIRILQSSWIGECANKYLMKTDGKKGMPNMISNDNKIKIQMILGARRGFG